MDNILALALVLVTIWYAWQTQQMVREMRAGRQSSVRPHLRLDIHLIGVSVLMQIENVGVGPAVDCSCVLKATSPTLDTPQQATWNTPLLRSGESRLMHFPLGESGSVLTFSDIRDKGYTVSLEGSCADIDGIKHEVMDHVDFGEHADRGPEVTVSGSLEKWPKHLETIAKEAERLRKAVENLEREG